MNPERWQQLKPLLKSALERAPQERAAFLNEICAGDERLRGELESFIASYEQAESFIERPAVELAAPLFATMQTDVADGQMINFHSIVGKLGEGGMGVVYLAVDQRPGRRMEKLSLARFIVPVCSM